MDKTKPNNDKHIELSEEDLRKVAGGKGKVKTPEPEPPPPIDPPANDPK